MIQVHFSNYFNINESILDDYGAFNISLINDLPLFVDPFLLFNSEKSEYQDLHNDIITYLSFLKEKSVEGFLTPALVRAWYSFGEVKQNWFGYSKFGNSGRGLGQSFANALSQNLNTIFSSFGEETLTAGSHMEKLCLIDTGVGRDSISDFTTNLIKRYLLEYTQTFAQNHLDKRHLRQCHIPKVKFNYLTETWSSAVYELPYINDDYVILTPRDMLSKDDVWINKGDLFKEYNRVVSSVSNDQLRDQLNNYFYQVLPRNATHRERLITIARVVRKYPVLIEHYIKYKELHGDQAIRNSKNMVDETHNLFVARATDFVDLLAKNSSFYEITVSTKAQALQRINYMKDVIENKGGHRFFYWNGKPIRKETDLHILYRLTWFASHSDVSPEANDGRGPADYKISMGAWDKTIVEFKLASNSSLKRNLQKQVEVYKKASDAESGLKVILYFSQSELRRVQAVLKVLDLLNNEDIILIDARRDNKPSGSRA